MAEETDALRRRIQSQREALGENIQALESKVRQTTDWRTWVDRKPLLLLGVAFSGGLYLSSKFGR